MSKAINKKRRSRERASKSLLGDFVVKFEDVMDKLRDSMHFILRKDGLRTREFATILLHDSTAGSLKFYYLGLVKIYHKKFLGKDTISSVYLSKLIDKITEALELRNVILHSTWDFFMDGKDSKDDTFSGQRFKINKEKGLYNYFDKLPSKTEFRTFIKSLELLSNAVSTSLNNMSEGRPLEKQNVELKNIIFKWKGSDFPYQDLLGG